MRTIGDILRLVLAGIWLAIGLAVAGALLCITIIGISFGVHAFKLSILALWPFTTEVVRSETTSP